MEVHGLRELGELKRLVLFLVDIIQKSMIPTNFLNTTHKISYMCMIH